MTAASPLRRTLIVAALLAALSACIEQNGNAAKQDEPAQNPQTDVVVGDQPVVGGDSPTVTGGSAACESFRQANAVVTTRIDPGCTQCSSSEAAAAIDGDLATAADLVVNGAAPAQGVALRATAQAGLIFPAGRLAGVFYSAPAGTTQSTMVTISTLAGGVVQESTSSNNTSGISGGRSRNFTGIRTSKPFDAVEIFINNNQAETDPTFRVFEFCSNHR
ncbi:MAG: hypothetical protein V4650_13810 [Pseudomonadota bacterium]